MSEEIKNAVAAILASTSVTFESVYTGQQKRDEWDCDGWRCTFQKQTRSNPAKPYASETFEFYTGTGCREENRVMARQLLREGYKRHLHGARFAAVSKPVPPHPADVLNSLIRDSDACGMSFYEWCGEFGYDTDSRKAHQTYMDCQANAEKLARVFTPDVIRQLSEALQEY